MFTLNPDTRVLQSEEERRDAPQSSVAHTNRLHPHVVIIRCAFLQCGLIVSHISTFTLWVEVVVCERLFIPQLTGEVVGEPD